MARHGAPSLYIEKDHLGTHLPHFTPYSTEQVTQAIKEELTEIGREAVNCIKQLKRVEEQ